MKKINKKGFTLVELLAVIVILAIILVIAVPKVMTIIEDSKKATLESTAKMIASQAEKAFVQNTVLDKQKEIECADVVKINNQDYERCIIEFDNSGKAKVNIKGSGKFAGINICNGTKNNVTASDTSCNVSYGKASTYIQNLEAFTENNGLNKDTTVDKNIRYAGANPNNKVYFNCKDKDANDVEYGETNYDYAASCEVWRIIGVFDVDNGNGKIEKRIKIVRDAFTDESGNIINMSYDSSIGGAEIENSVNYGKGINQWGESTYVDGSIYEGADLMRMLNGYYIGKDDECKYCNEKNQGECENDCSSSVTPLSSTSLSMVENSLWKIGAQAWLDTLPLSIMYAAERGKALGKTCLSTSIWNEEPLCTDTVNRTSEWIGLVGLVYLSDYGYASDDISCASDLQGEDSTCKNNNWLHPSSWYWTLSPPTDTPHATVMWVAHSSFTSNTFAVYSAGGVRPSLYLSSNVQITGGDGNTIPFKLAI